MRFYLLILLCAMGSGCVQTGAATSAPAGQGVLHDEEQIAVTCKLTEQPEHKLQVAADSKKWGFEVIGAEVTIKDELVAMKLLRLQDGKAMEPWNYKNMELDETTDGIGRVNFGFGTTGKERNRFSFGATLQRYPQGDYVLVMRLQDTPLKFQCESQPTS